MTRRRFVFWLSFGMFSVAEKLGINGLDKLAAATLRSTEKSATSPAKDSTPPEHWTVETDENWTWFERENFVDKEWILTGTTAPVNKTTGERKTDKEDYLADNAVPESMRTSSEDGNVPAAPHNGIEFRGHHASETVRSRHGRPPSEWLRSLHADELRIWLKTIDVPEAGVSGMTYWEHLTRDHLFDAKNIEGLKEDEQALLHAAAHYGY